MITTDLDALYKAILQHPAEDTPRLMFADALEETGDPASLVRAEFIRTQMELHLLGEPHKFVSGMMRDRGPDYFEVVADYDCGIGVGDRVDVVEWSAGRGKKREHTRDGLLVMKVLPDDPVLGTVILSLKRDENSVPYPEKKASQLTEKCNKMIERNWQAWVSCPFPIAVGTMLSVSPSHSMGVCLRCGSGRPSHWMFRRGFISFIQCEWNHWRDWGDWGDKLMTYEPITTVEFMDMPEIVMCWATDVLGKSTAKVNRVSDHVATALDRQSPKGKAQFFPRDTPEDEQILTLLKADWPSVTKWILPPG